MSSAITCPHQDIYINHPQGQIFSRIWTPLNYQASLAPIILLHDSLGCVAVWRDFPMQLAICSGRQVIAYDRLGFGQSSARLKKIAFSFIEDEAKNDFALVKQQLNIKEFVVLGHSVGGSMAVHCAASYPQDCQGLITIAAQAFTETNTRVGLQQAKIQFADPQQFARLIKYHGQKSAWVLSSWLDTWLDAAFDHWSLAEVLPKVLCPTLAIHGQFDEYGSMAHPKTIAQSVSGQGRWWIVEGAYHVPHREKNEEVLVALKEFLTP